MVSAQPPQIEKTVYGEGSANDANVVFPFDLALPAAQAIWEMAEAVRQSSTGIRSKNDDDTFWKGPHHDTTDTKVATYEDSASSVATALEGLANGIAAAWAAARGQQNRINKARYVQHEEESESAVNKFFDNFCEDDYGPPPDDPATPGPPGFAEPGGARMYGEFGP